MEIFCTSSVKVTNDFHWGCDQSKVNVLLFLDFSRAFDSVPFELLLKRLNIYFNFSESALLMIKNYLNNRLRALFYDSHWSSFIKIASKVPQVSILWPLLFLFFFINDYSQCPLHANGMQIFRYCEVCEITNSITFRNNDVKQVVQWSFCNEISINTT